MKKLAWLIAALIICICTIIALAAMWVADVVVTKQGEGYYTTISIPFAVPCGNVAPEIDFAALREGMPDVVGWIQSAGTNINYPIMQGADNDFYLHHLPDGTQNRMGSIFLDYRNNANFSGQTIFIYGHNMATENKFASLKNYLDHEYFLQHGTMYIFTPRQNFEIVIFAGYDFDSAVEQPPMYFATAQCFEGYIESLLSRSFIQSGIVPEYGDSLVFLITCFRAYTSTWRRIIVGVLLDF